MTEQVSVPAGDERWPRIALGFTLASLAAGYTLPLLLLLPIARDGWEYLVKVGLFLLSGFVLSVLFGLLAVLPAVFLIFLAEARRWRSAAYYAVGGAGVGLVWLGILVVLFPAKGPPVETWPFVVLASMPGLAGGLVYWWVAGKSAGPSRAARRRHPFDSLGGDAAAGRMLPR